MSYAGFCDVCNVPYYEMDALSHQHVQTSASQSAAAKKQLMDELQKEIRKHQPQSTVESAPVKCQCGHVHQLGRIACGYFIRKDPHQGEIFCMCDRKPATQSVESAPEQISRSVTCEGGGIGTLNYDAAVSPSSGAGECTCKKPDFQHAICPVCDYPETSTAGFEALAKSMNAKLGAEGAVPGPQDEPRKDPNTNWVLEYAIELENIQRSRNHMLEDERGNRSPVLTRGTIIDTIWKYLATPEPHSPPITSGYVQEVLPDDAEGPSCHVCGAPMVRQSREKVLELIESLAGFGTDSKEFMAQLQSIQKEYPGWDCLSCGATTGCTPAQELPSGVGQYAPALAGFATPAEGPRKEEHPEDFCADCGRENCVWFAPSPIWNAVMRSGQPEPIICPICFAKRAEAKGFSPVWEFKPEVIENVQQEAQHQTSAPPPSTDEDAECGEEKQGSAQSLSPTSERQQDSSETLSTDERLTEITEFFNVWWIKGNPSADVSKHAADLLRLVAELRGDLKTVNEAWHADLVQWGQEQKAAKARAEAAERERDELKLKLDGK